MGTVRVTSEFWLGEIGKHEQKCFHVLWRTIILGCCSCYKGAAAYLGMPEDSEGYTGFAIEGRDGARCFIHRDVLEQWKRMGPMDDGDYLFVVQTVGRFRVDFPGGLPV